MADNLVNTVKHHIVLNPNHVQRVNIIGCGALGSKVALEVAKLGVKEIHLYDFDTVSSENIANQGFSHLDVGKLKVQALGDFINHMTGCEPIQHNEKVETSTVLQGITFLLVDSMKAREEIYNSSIKGNGLIPFFIDARMGVSSYQVVTVNPISKGQTDSYEKEMMYKDEEVSSEQTRACTVTPSIGATSGMAANHAIWQFIKAVNVYFGKLEYTKNVQIEKDVYVALTDTSYLSSHTYPVV